jgi:hypothetical protein
MLEEILPQYSCLGLRNWEVQVGLPFLDLTLDCRCLWYAEYVREFGQISSHKSALETQHALKMAWIMDEAHVFQGGKCHPDPGIF